MSDTDQVTSTASPPVISARSVTKSWGSAHVFSDLTAEVGPGITGLLGSNGSGKTTLLGMMLGLHNPTSGELRVLGEDPAAAGPDLRQMIGYSPEHHNLPSDMAAHDFVRHLAEVHGLPRREATTRSSDALWLVGLGEERGRPVGTMSTGQRQRVKLAQAIAHGPKLVLLDEPTDGLDPVQRDDMLALIRRIGTEFEIDVVLSSHLLEEVERIADNVLIVSDGEALASGTIDDLRTSNDVGVTVEIERGLEETVALLTAQGYDVRRDRRRLHVTGADNDRLLLAIRDAVAGADAEMRRLSPARNSLEDIFLTEVYGR